MERETTTISVGTHTFEAKTYATKLEENAIQDLIRKGGKIDVVGETAKITDFDASTYFAMQQEMIRQLVTNMDGSADDIVGRCVALPSYEFDELVSALDGLISKKKS